MWKHAGVELYRDLNQADTVYIRADTIILHHDAAGGHAGVVRALVRWSSGLTFMYTMRWIHTVAYMWLIS